MLQCTLLDMVGFLARNQPRHCRQLEAEKFSLPNITQSGYHASPTNIHIGDVIPVDFSALHGISMLDTPLVL
ncbi:hypothetical protein IM543_02930 [Massilia sp. UMI-21]|nr:hypothetical protein IM543_02930 [Massilia sp. UMI-21]